MENKLKYNWLPTMITVTMRSMSVKEMLEYTLKKLDNLFSSINSLSSKVMPFMSVKLS